MWTHEGSRARDSLPRPLGGDDARAPRPRADPAGDLQPLRSALRAPRARRDRLLLRASLSSERSQAGREDALVLIVAAEREVRVASGGDLVEQLGVVGREEKAVGRIARVRVVDDAVLQCKDVPAR